MFNLLKMFSKPKEAKAADKTGEKPNEGIHSGVPLVETLPEGVFIETGSYSLDGGLTVRPGFPLTKTNIARKPSKSKGEIVCMQCDGDGWDANSGGGVFICPTCDGTGVEDGNATCVCGHKRFEHYSNSTCEHDYLDLYAEYPHRMLHPGEYDIDKRPCKCDSFVEGKQPSSSTAGKQNSDKVTTAHTG
ncbi:hypothetical protein MUP59_07040 [Candidatus Bathyarchaeota archaeon]|nr:hypothetical protein [Candidatus Bathyarchaeota archaeon]